MLDIKPEHEAIVVERLHNFILITLHKNFEHLRQANAPSGAFASDENTLITDEQNDNSISTETTQQPDKDIIEASSTKRIYSWLKAKIGRLFNSKAKY